ncbi:MAG: right-handed parallel beta-helix repeat-containing protein [Anaerolineales bacterium]|nr:right-handed parallel beta-helix repeat-containing protein [Anaerolineales bacterium]
MFKQNRLTVLSIAVLLALLVAAVLPFAALAQDGGEQPPAGEAVPPADEPVVDEAVPPADEPVVDEVVPPVDEAVPPAGEAVPPVDEVVPVVDETLTVPEILAEIPAETDLVVLDANGEALALASEAAAENLFTGDPMWCPAGKTPADGVAGGCTASFTKFSGAGGLIEALQTSAFSGPGTIYVESAYNATAAGDYGQHIVFDYNTVLLTDLVFQGGWDFASNSVVGTSTIELGAGKDLVFLNWGNFGDPSNLTLKDINVINSGGLLVVSGIGAGTAAAPVTGLPLVAPSNVTLDNVSVTNSSFTATLGVTDVSSSLVPVFLVAGAMISTTGDVTVTNSEFNNNKYTGLSVFSEKGAVTITNSVFNNNGYIGLNVFALNGDITLENVTANDNGFGTPLDTISGFGTLPGPIIDPYGIFGSGIILATGSGGMTSAGVSSTSVVVGGKITLNNVIANGNFGSGVVILSGGDASIACSRFEKNGKYGVDANLPGTLNMDTTYLNGNASGDVIILGGGTMVQQSSGCEETRRKNKDFGFPQVIAVLTSLTDAELPGTLPDGKTFVAGASVKLMLAGEEIEEWPAGVQVSFDIPAGMEPPFTVLSWNGTAWVEIPSAVVDGKVVFTVTGPGTFVLVSP